MKFEFQNPTHLIFGAGTLSQVGEVVHKHGKKALVVTGGVRVKPRGTTARHHRSVRFAAFGRQLTGRRACAAATCPRLTQQENNKEVQQ